MSSVPITEQVQTRRRAWGVAVAWALCMAALAVAIVAGFSLEAALWDATEPIRFRFDITNAYQQGMRASQLGVLNVYDDVALKAHVRPDGVREFGLDYPPLRLTVAWLWYRWTYEHYPQATQWQNTWEFNWPLLMMNRGLMLLAMASVFGIVLTVRRWAVPPSPSAWQSAWPVILASIAAVFCWFNLPANLIAFGWPQWDVCVPAFFLAALFAGLRRWWLAAGIVLAAGGMFKGQLLIVLPVMIVWPLLAGELAGLVRFCIGLLAGIGVIASPFLFHSGSEIVRPEIAWLAASLVGATGVARGWRYLPDRAGRLRWVALCVVVACCAVFGWIAAWYAGAIASAIVAVALYVLAWRLSWRAQGTVLSLAIASAIWIPAVLTPNSWSWLHVGLLYGSEHFNQMHMGHPSNLPAILQASFGVQRPDTIALTLPGDISLSWRALLRGMASVGALLCAIAMAVRWRRRSPLILLPAATVWMLIVTFPAQIHERYIMYSALVSAPLVALGLRWAVLHLALCLIATAPILQGMFYAGDPSAFMAHEFGPGFGAGLVRLVLGTFPGIGWALVCLTLVCLWRSMDLRADGAQTKTALLPDASASSTEGCTPSQKHLRSSEC